MLLLLLLLLLFSIIFQVDHMEGEQTWPTEDELAEAEQEGASKTRTKRVPKGTSEYQAAWILDSDNGKKYILDFKHFFLVYV